LQVRITVAHFDNEPMFCVWTEWHILIMGWHGETELMLHTFSDFGIKKKWAAFSNFGGTFTSAFTM